MTLLERIDADLKEAMTRREESRVGTLRFLKSALKYAILEKKSGTLSDADALAVIQKQVKQRRESIDQFKKAGREDLVEKESRELETLLTYIPAQLEDAELDELVTRVAREAGAVDKKDFGRVMKLVTEKLAGRAEPRRISESLGKVLR